MQAPHVVTDEDVCRPPVTVGEKGSVLLGRSEMGTGSSGKYCVPQLIVPGDSLAMAPAADSVVAIAVTIGLATGHAIASLLIDWKAQSVQDGNAEFRSSQL